MHHMELDEIIYNALTAEPQLSAATDGRIYSTCIEVPPTDDDNTPLPYIVINEEQSHNDQATKDSVWESIMDVVNVGVIINAESPKAVKRLRRLARTAVGAYVATMQRNAPYLLSLSYDGITWDWTKPCYYDTLHYSCSMNISTDHEQE